MTISSKDARAMLDTARKNGIVHQMGFNYRFIPAVMLAKKLIDDGKIGKIYHFRAKYLQDYLLDPDFPISWRMEKANSGFGALGDIGSHIIDLSRYLVGEIAGVSGMCKTFIEKRPTKSKKDIRANEFLQIADVTVDDAAIFLAEFQCGALGTFEATRMAAGRKNEISFEINGSKGSVKFDLQRFNFLEYCVVDDSLQGFKQINVTEQHYPFIKNWWPSGHPIGYEHTFANEFYSFTEAIAAGKQSKPDFEDGLMCTLIMEAVHKSWQERKWVEVEEG
jgi:predicted dehydrogenase